MSKKRTCQSSKYKNTTATSEKITVTVADAGVEIKQTANVKFTLNFGTAVAALAVEDINVDEIVKVAGGNDKINYLVKAVTLSEDKKSADVELFFELTDGATYEVTVKGYDTETFVASNGVPVSAVLHSDPHNINKRNVTVGNTATIYATLYDAAGMDVTTAEKVAKLVFNIKYVDSEYETSDTTLYFTEAGDRAVVTAEYHTNEYLENGDEKDFFTSAPYTFVAVSKSQVEVEKIVKYTTNGNLTMAKDSIKLDAGEKQQLMVLIKLSDDPYSDHLQVLSSFDDYVYTSDGDETLGKVKFTSLTPDILDVYPGTNNAVMLSPRKEGNGRIKVSYVTTVNNYEVETGIGIVTVKVTGKITLTSATIASSSIAVCINPDADATDLVKNPFVAVDIIDQYYAAYGAVNVKIEGNNDISKLTMAGTNKAVKYGNKGELYRDYYGENKDDVPKNWLNGVVVDYAKLAEVMSTLKGTAKEKTTFSYTITVSDKNAPYGQKTIKFQVNAKKATDINNDKALNEKDMSIVIEVVADELKAANNNVARFDTPENNQQQYYDRNTEDEKKITFAAYYAYDRNAKWSEIELIGMLPETKQEILSPTTSTGCYYVINKNGKRITSYADDSLGGYTTANNEVLLNLSKTKNSDYDSNFKITTYENWTDVGNVYGAGNYEFIVYEIVKVKNSDGVLENTAVQKARTSMNVTCDAGSYKFLARENAKLTNEMLVDATENMAILRSFKIADKDGSTFQDKNVGVNTVKFDNGQTRYYKIITKNNTDKSVYVEKIIFWDVVAYDSWADLDNDGANETPDPASASHYAEYEVKVGYFLEKDYQ